MNQSTPMHSKSHSEQHLSPWRGIPICWVAPLRFASALLHPTCQVISPAPYVESKQKNSQSNYSCPYFLIFDPLSFVGDRTDPEVTGKKEKVRKSGRRQDRGKRESNLSLRSVRRARKREASSQCVLHSCATAGYAVTGAACREQWGCSKVKALADLVCFQPLTPCWDLPTGSARSKKCKQRTESRWR